MHHTSQRPGALPTAIGVTEAQAEVEVDEAHTPESRRSGIIAPDWILSEVSEYQGLASDAAESCMRMASSVVLLGATNADG